MLRALGNVLIVAAGIVLAVGVALGLLAGMVQRVGPSAPPRLTALDSAARESPDRALGVVVLGEGGADGRPPPRTKIFFRFRDGWIGRAHSSRKGRAVCRRAGGLPIGRHAYLAHPSEAGPMLVPPAEGAVWVRRADRPFVWVDADAVLPRPVGAGVPPEACDALDVLARRYGLVYLVAGDLDRYVAARRRLPPGAAPARPFGPATDAPHAVPRRGRVLPDGPAIWTGAGGKSLARLKAAWPNVAGAIVATPQLREAVKRYKVHVLDVPHAGPMPGPGLDERRTRWQAAVEALVPEGERDRPGGEG